jgi:CheY-like chemotaxis protein
MSAAAEAQRPKRILVVDDEEDLRTFVAGIFDGLGYVVECAEDGAAALQKMATTTPDLVVLDLMMPVMDGWGVLDRLRGMARHPPVVILSAYADCPRAIKAGAVGCLSKPFRLQDLVGTCENVLRAA